jgi:hypothetical protein
MKSTQRAPQLAHKPRLADASIADDRHQLRLSVGCNPLVRQAELLKLALAPDKSAAEPAGGPRSLSFAPPMRYEALQKTAWDFGLLISRSRCWAQALVSSPWA